MQSSMLWLFELIQSPSIGCVDSVDYQAGDYLLFGPETRGLPDAIRSADEITAVIRIPMLPHSRSLNLSNAAAVIIYEAWRQAGFPGV